MNKITFEFLYTLLLVSFVVSEKELENASADIDVEDTNRNVDEDMLINPDQLIAANKTPVDPDMIINPDLLIVDKNIGEDGDVNDEKLENASAEFDVEDTNRPVDDDMLINPDRLIAANKTPIDPDMIINPDLLIVDKNKDEDGIIINPVSNDANKDNDIDADMIINPEFFEDKPIPKKEKNEEDLLYEHQRQKEKEAGDFANLFGTNEHYSIPVNYEDFGRRFVLNYPYYEKIFANNEAETKLDNDIKQYMEAKKVSDKKLLPVKAPPEFVIAIARQSALLEATQRKNSSDEVTQKEILRSGDFFDGVWKEDVDMSRMLRTGNNNNNRNKLESVTVEITPGSKLYELISILKEKSPRLLYVINKK